MTSRKVEYLGFDVYATAGVGNSIALATKSDGFDDPSSGIIYLEPKQLDALIRFARSLGWTVGGEEGA